MFSYSLLYLCHSTKVYHSTTSFCLFKIDSYFPKTGFWKSYTVFVLNSKSHCRWQAHICTCLSIAWCNGWQALLKSEHGRYQKQQNFSWYICRLFCPVFLQKLSLFSIWLSLPPPPPPDRNNFPTKQKNYKPGEQRVMVDILSVKDSEDEFSKGITKRMTRVVVSVTQILKWSNKNSLLMQKRSCNSWHPMDWIICHKSAFCFILLPINALCKTLNIATKIFCLRYLKYTILLLKSDGLYYLLAYSKCQSNGNKKLIGLAKKVKGTKVIKFCKFGSMENYISFSGFSALIKGLPNHFIDCTKII